MENISMFLMMYLIAFYHEVRNLPRMAGYYFYAGLAVVMAVVAAVNCPVVQPFLPWPFMIPQDASVYNVVLALGFVLLAVVSARYMKQKTLVEQYEENGYVVEPGQLGGFAHLLWLHEVLFALWVTMICFFVMWKVIPDLPSAEWAVAVGTVEFFVFAWLFCRLQNLLFDKDPEMGKLSKSYLTELQMREVLTEAEQAWLKKQFADVGIIKKEGEEN